MSISKCTSRYRKGGGILIIIFLTLTEEQYRFIERMYNEKKLQYYNIAKTILKSSDDTEDAVSEAFRKIIENIDKILKLECHIIDPYCVVILKHESYNILRKKNQLPNMDETKLTDTNPSKEFERRMRKVLTGKSPQRQNHKAKGWTRHISTITRYAAIILLVMTVTFSATLAVNADLRAKFFHWVVQTFKEYSSFTTDVTQEEIDEMKPVDFSQYEVHYIPEGFELKERNVFHNSISYYYIGQNEESILILIESRDTIINSDTENATINEITYKDNPAYWWTKEEITHLIWQQDNMLCKITAHQTIEETMKIADNIKKS